MRLWQNLIFSVLGHLGLFCIVLHTPLAVYKPPRCIQIRLISGAAFDAEAGTGAGPDIAAPLPERGGVLRQEAKPPMENFAVQAPPAVREKQAPPEADCINKKENRKIRPKKLPRKAAAKPPAALEEPKAVDRGRAAASSSEAESPAEQTSVAPGTVKQASPAGGALSGEGQGTGRQGAGKGPGVPGIGPLDAPFGSGNGPRFRHRAMPRYPSVARRLGKEATVLLRVTIDERGRPVDVEILSKAGSGFEEEAVRAVRASTFVPAKANGYPVKSRALLPVRFVLTNPG